MFLLIQARLFFKHHLQVKRVQNSSELYFNVRGQQGMDVSSHVDYL